jgi:hypothetical protein
MTNKNQLMRFLRRNGYEMITINTTNISSFNPFEDSKIDEINNENDQNYVGTLIELGFDGENDFYRCVYDVNLVDIDKRRKFEIWKREDGTKQGLLAI